MPIITIRFPTKEEEERSHRFTVHRNYLSSIELFLGALYGHGDDQARALVDTQRALPAFGRIQRRPVADVAELRRLLAISWASETQLRLGDLGGDAFLRYSNAWAPVQAYYAVYMSIHAYLVPAGMGGLIDDHTSTLRTVALQGLVDGIRDFTEVRQERWRRRYRSLGTALIASSMWIDDKELIDAIGRLAAASIIVTKQGRRPADLRKLEALDDLNDRTPGMPIRAFSALSGLAPTVDGQPALIGPYSRPDDTVVPTIRTLGWRKSRNENVPIVHAKLALLGHLWWHDEDGRGMVTDVIGFSARRLWISSTRRWLKPSRTSTGVLRTNRTPEGPSLAAGLDRCAGITVRGSELCCLDTAGARER